MIQILYKNIEWAINIDPEVLNACIKDTETALLLNTLITFNFTSLTSTPFLQQSSYLEKYNFMFIEEKRLTSKILTILTRDHSVLKRAYSGGKKDAFNDVFRFSI